jgi:hypothetical protein
MDASSATECNICFCDWSEPNQTMGCVASKLDINDVHPNMFAVNNVDDVSTLISIESSEIQSHSC